MLRGVIAATQESREISGFLLLLSQGGNSCRPHWEGDGVMGIGESVVWQDQKIALCTDNCYFDSERETYLVQEERKRGRVCSGLDGIFPLVDMLFAKKLKRLFFSFFFLNLQRCFHSCMCEPSRFDHRLEILHLKNTLMVGLTLEQGRHFRLLLNVEPTELPVYSSAIEESSTKALSRDVAPYHETYFHEGQIRQEIYSMTAALSLPKIRVLRYTGGGGGVENDLL